MRVALVFIALSLLAVGPASAQVTGRANVLNSDTIAIGDQTFRLYGVDGIEFHQFCYVDGEPWACGAAATRALQVLLDPVVVTCEPTGEAAGDLVLAVCTSEEGDIAEIMTQQGWALALSDQSENYIAAEETARESKEGVWRGVVAEPWVFRDDIEAIERVYVERLMALLPAVAEDMLVGDEGGLPIFADVEVTVGVEGGAIERELVLPGFEPGFIDAAIPERGVFAWNLPAEALAVKRAEILQAINNLAIESVWLELGQRPGNLVEVEDAQTYYDAISANGAALIAAGRQPILTVASVELPIWITTWFEGDAPEGAEVTRNEEIVDPNYVGTIDGVDVYVGKTPASDSYLFPADILEAVAYEEGPDGNIVDVAPGTLEGAAALVIRFSQSIQWLDGDVVTIRYPYEEPTGPYGG